MSSITSGREKVTLGLVFILIVAVLSQLNLTGVVDRTVYDWHIKFWPNTPSDDVVLIQIDDQSLNELGRWPWPRRFHAHLLENLHEANAVGIDVLFVERDTSDPKGDELLANAIRQHGRVVLPVAPIVDSDGRLIELSSLGLIRDAAKALGHVDVELDKDGVSRSLFLKAGVGEAERSSLPLAMVELKHQVSAQGERRPNLLRNPQAWQRDQRVLLPLQESSQHILNVSYIDVLNGKFPPRFFKNKWVIVGMDATGLGDRIPTPVSGEARYLSGAEYESQVLDLILHNNLIQPLGDLNNLLISILLVLLLIVFFGLFHSEWSWLALVLSIGVVLLTCILLSVVGAGGMHYWLAPGPALLTILVGYLILQRHQIMAFVKTLSHREEHVEVAMKTVSDGIIITDKLGRVEFMNPNAEALTGYLLKNVRGLPLHDVMLVQDATGEAYPIDLVMKAQASDQRLDLPDQHFLQQRDGSLMPVRAHARPFLDESQRVTGVVIAFDENKPTSQDAKDAVIDELTQLPNLTLLYDRLGHAITNANRNKRLLGVLYLDLDELNKINGVYGHERTDQILKEIASRLTSRGRTGDTVARVGDDEFIVVLENLESTDPIASVATSLLDVIHRPCLVDGEEIVVEGSIGISVYPKDGMDAKSLKEHAFTAMKRAKKNKRQGNTSGFYFYSTKMNDWALDRLLSEKDLRNALSSRAFELYYQPRIDSHTGHIVAVEALIRWHRSGEGMILPNSFIPLAERNGLITEIGSWVLGAATEQMRQWKMAGLDLPRMAVNLSPRQFMQHDLLDMITRFIDRAGIEPHLFELEITENTLVRDADRCIEILKEFRALGGIVSIDDFGTGYSSLSYLKNFPVDMLKIDKVFTRDITSEPDHAAITMAVISMAHNLNLRVVAEGVENEAQLKFLRHKGCDELQGFYFNEPVPAQEMTQMLEDKRHLAFDEILDIASTTVLMVDDDPDVLTKMEHGLRNEGYRILLANSADEALNLLASHSIGVVLSDELMPGMPGSELLRVVRNLYPNTVRMLLSANADRDAIIKAINTGAIFKFMAKPIDPNELKFNLRDAFAAYQNTKQLPASS